MGLGSIIELVQLLESTEGTSYIGQRVLGQEGYNSRLFTLCNRPVARVLHMPVSYRNLISLV